MIFKYFIFVILVIMAIISIWFDYHPKIEPLWSVKDIFMTYLPKRQVGRLC